nr:MAG TPA: hypothetical protein [Caudoviricetes sp.]
MKRSKIRGVPILDTPLFYAYVTSVCPLHIKNVDLV